MELVLLLLIALFVVSYRKNDGESVYKFIAKEVTGLYDKYVQMGGTKTSEQFAKALKDLIDA